MSSSAQAVAAEWFEVRDEMRALAKQQSALRKRLKTLEPQLLAAMNAEGVTTVSVQGRSLSQEEKLAET